MKKGMYFTLEAIIATLIMSVGFGVILYLFVTPQGPPLHTTQTTLTDAADLFLLPIGTLDGGSCSPTGDAVTNGDVTDLSLPFFQQLGEFYYKSKTECTQAEVSVGTCAYNEWITTCLVGAGEDEFIDVMNLEDLNMEVSIDDIVYYTTDGVTGRLAKEDAEIILPYRVLLAGTYTKTILNDDGTTEQRKEFWGPYVGEIKIWE